MKEQLYTIPVNDAFDKKGECPICDMYNELLQDAVEFTLGPSYMEDDVRMETNRLGFCSEHLKLLYERQNRLGLALMLMTHMDRVAEDIKGLQKQGRTRQSGLFKKSDGQSAVYSYVKQKTGSCFVCERIEGTFERYIVTVLELYAKDEVFAEKFRQSKGFCLEHYGLLYEKSADRLSKDKLKRFTEDLDQCFLAGFERVRDDLDWYTRKFDYRFANEPWKNSKDAVQRGMQKTASVFYEAPGSESDG